MPQDTTTTTSTLVEAFVETWAEVLHEVDAPSPPWVRSRPPLDDVDTGPGAELARSFAVVDHLTREMGAGFGSVEQGARPRGDDPRQPVDLDDVDGRHGPAGCP